VKINSLKDLEAVKAKGLKKVLPNKIMFSVGMGTCGIGNGAQEVLAEISQEIKKSKLTAIVKPVGCFGYCSREPLVNLYIPGKPLVIFKEVKPKDVKKIFTGIKTGK
jgi:NADH-quinone oxidoreductase subunit F